MRNPTADPLCDPLDHTPFPPTASHPPLGARRAVPPPAYFHCSALDNPAPAQLVYFHSDAVGPTVAIDDQQPLCRQEAEDRIAEAVVVGGDLVRIETKLRRQRSQDNLVDRNRRLGERRVSIGESV